MKPQVKKWMLFSVVISVQKVELGKTFLKQVEELEVALESIDLIWIKSGDLTRTLSRPVDEDSIINLALVSLLSLPYAGGIH